MLTPCQESYDQPRQHIIEQRHHFVNNSPSSQSYGFSCSHIRMRELDHKESWALKNWCFWTVVLDKTLEHPLNSKEIKPVNPKENQSWIFIGRIDAESEAPILWPPGAKSWFSGKKSLCWERLRSGGERCDRGRDIWMASMDMTLSKLWEIVQDGETSCAADHGAMKRRTQLSHWIIQQY